MRSRSVLLVAVLVLGIPVAPLAVEAQQSGKVYRLGLLSPATPPAPSDPTAVVLIPKALGELGYVEGKLDRLPGLARELSQLRVEVILAITQAAVQAAKDATGAIPIVFFATADPIALGWSPASLGRAGRSPGWSWDRKPGWQASGWS
jgi:putative ABC transport system substrate-binding protein